MDKEFTEGSLTICRSRERHGRQCYYCKDEIYKLQEIYIIQDDEPIYYYGKMHVHYLCLSKFLYKYNNEKNN
jgi:hypothetical protein